MRRLTTRETVLAGLMGALLMALKEALAVLPGEPVTPLILLYTLELPAVAPWAIAAFVLLEFVLYGFGLWSWMYLYVWFLLYWLVRRLRRMDSAPGWAVVSGAYGLAFGALCTPVYLFTPTWCTVRATLSSRWWSTARCAGCSPPSAAGCKAPGGRFRHGRPPGDLKKKRRRAERAAARILAAARSALAECAQGSFAGTVCSGAAPGGGPVRAAPAGRPGRRGCRPCAGGSSPPASPTTAPPAKRRSPGTPPTMVYGGTSPVTTARAAMTAPSPTVTPDRITASYPTQTSLPRVMPPLLSQADGTSRISSPHSSKKRGKG